MVVVVVAAATAVVVIVGVAEVAVEVGKVSLPYSFTLFGPHLHCSPVLKGGVFVTGEGEMSVANLLAAGGANAMPINNRRW